MGQSLSIIVRENWAEILINREPGSRFAERVSTVLIPENLIDCP
jgi:hypothetical protein